MRKFWNIRKINFVVRNFFNFFKKFVVNKKGKDVHNNIEKERKTLWKQNGYTEPKKYSLSAVVCLLSSTPCHLSKYITFTTEGSDGNGLIAAELDERALDSAIKTAIGNDKAPTEDFVRGFTIKITPSEQLSIGDIVSVEVT